MNRKIKLISAVLMLVISAVGCSSDDSSSVPTYNNNNNSTSTVVSTYQPIVNYQTVLIEEYQEEIIEMDEDELITIEFIQNSNIYEGQKYVLIQRLEMGEAITFGDLVAEGIFEEISVEQINLISEIEKQFKIIAEPNSVITITSSTEELFLINVVEEEKELEEEIGESSSLNEDGEEIDEVIEETEEIIDEVVEETEEVTDEIEVADEEEIDEVIEETEEVTDEVEVIDEEIIEEVGVIDEEIIEEVEEETEEVTDEIEVIDEEIIEEVEEETEEVTDEIEVIDEEEINEVIEETEEVTDEVEVTDEEVIDEVIDETEEIDELIEETEEEVTDEFIEEVIQELIEMPAEEVDETAVDEFEETVVDEVEETEEVEEIEEPDSYLVEDVRYFEITPIANGEGTIEVTITNANYETVYLTIPVMVTAPQTVVYVATESVEVENEVTETYSYIVYPENAQVTIESSDNEVVSTIIEDNVISITGNSIGEADVVITCESADFETTNKTISTSITPTKTTLEITEESINVACYTEVTLGLTKNEDANVTFEYSTDELEVETDGCCLVVKPLVEGEFTLKVIAREDDYYDNEVELTIMSTIEQLELEVQDTIVNIETDEVVEIGLYVGAEEYELEILSTDGVTAELVENIIEITATQDGTITINATKEGYADNTRTIDVWFEKESIEFDQKDLAVVVVGDEVTTSVITTTVEECDFSLTTSEGVTAEYDAETGEISITATENGVVTVIAEKEGYAPSKHYIAVTFEAGELGEVDECDECDEEEVAEVSLLLDVTDTTISSVEETQAVNVYVMDDAEVSLSSSTGINVDYVDNQIIITADNSGTITVTATKEGYAMTTSKIVVNYQPEEEVTDIADLVDDLTDDVQNLEETVGDEAVDTEEVTEETTEEVVVDFASDVIALVNTARVSEGLTELALNDNLMATAQVRSEEIVEVFSHTRADGSSWSTCLIDYDFTNIGENIANGQKTAESVMTAWLNSDGHRANIMNEKFSEIGVGVYEHNGRYYWVQIFGNQK